MIRTAKILNFAFRLREDGRGMMAADVIEAAQTTVASAHDRNRFSGNLSRDVLSLKVKLRRSPDHLPRAGKNRALF
ncbi:MAG TPA: hypothetical protein VMR20_13055 [Verrucomicrobiae bacterium]|nr:hypothetical protein [Verrucomicrobiae bacterium]